MYIKAGRVVSAVQMQIAVCGVSPRRIAGWLDFRLVSGCHTTVWHVASRVHTCKYLRIHTHAYVCICPSVYVYIHIDVDVYRCMMCIYIYTYIYIYINMCIYIYTLCIYVYKYIRYVDLEVPPADCKSSATTTPEVIQVDHLPHPEWRPAGLQPSLSAATKAVPTNPNYSFREAELPRIQWP